MSGLEPLKPESVCAEADRIVSGDRRNSYGTPYQNFTDTAALWTVMLRKKLAPGMSVDAVDVALCMTQIKLAREAHLPKRDNRVDGCGYLKCADLVHETMDELIVEKQKKLEPTVEEVVIVLPTLPEDKITYTRSRPAVDCGCGMPGCKQ